MLIFPNKHKPVLKLLEKERNHSNCNWYFHIMILRRLTHYVKSLKNKQFVNNEKINGVVLALKNMIELYELSPKEKKNKGFLDSLAELVYEISLTKAKVCVKDLIGAYEILLNEKNCLNKVLVSLQIFLEDEENYEFPQAFTKNMWNVIFDGVNDEDKDVAQGFKDVLTYVVIVFGNNYEKRNYELKETEQDLFLYKSFMNKN